MSMRRVFKFLNSREKMMKVVFLLSSVFSVFALLSICIFLFASGIPTIADIGFSDFIFGTDWSPLGEEPSYGIFPMIVGSTYVTALATIIGVVLGLFTAIFLYKFCHKKIVGMIRHLINLLAGIPSVIFGLFGLICVVPILRTISPSGVGHGILAASIILSIMILPTIVSISLDSLNAVSKNYYEGALALGATKEQATFKVMIPAAKSGIFAGIVLAIGRAIGETMAVIMVIGGSSEMPVSVFQSIRTLTANIAMGAMELTGNAFNALIATGVVLFVFTLFLNVGFSLLSNKKKEKRKNKKSKEHKPSSNNFLIKAKLTISLLKERLTNGKYLFRILKIACYVCAIIAIASLVGIIVFIMVRGLSHVNFNFIFGEYTSANPTIRPALVGTLYLVFIALAISAPIGILTAIFLSEYAKKGRFVRIIRVAVETLAAIPSIVYGLFGYLVFVVFSGWGYSMLGGGITLAIMILPTIIRSTEESLLAIPQGLREGSLALGAGKMRTTFSVVLPNASPGIVSALILSIGRVISESAVLILTIGMVVNNVPGMMSPGTSLALDVYFFGSHGYTAEASATAVVLVVIVVAINMLAVGVNKLLTKRRG